MKTVYLILIMFLTACGGAGSDKEFLTLIESFKQDYKEFKGSTINITTTINFSDTENLGECLPEIKQIYISKSKWDDLLPAEQKALIYHELGHCELNYIAHRDEVVVVNESATIKASIMNSSIRQTLRDTNPQNVNDFYLYEFFNNDLTIWNSFNN